MNINITEDRNNKKLISLNKYFDIVKTEESESKNYLDLQKTIYKIKRNTSSLTLHKIDYKK